MFTFIDYVNSLAQRDLDSMWDDQLGYLNYLDEYIVDNIMPDEMGADDAWINYSESLNL